MSQLYRLWRFIWKVLGYQPFSWGSLLLLAGAYWSFSKIGVDQLDYVLIIVGAVALGLLVVAFLGTCGGAVYTVLCLREHKNEKDIRIVEGFPCQTGFVLNMPWWFPLVQCSWRWTKPDIAIEIFQSGERVVFPRRGHWEKVEREFWISDIFGICRIRFVHESNVDLLVQANMGKLEAPVFALGMQDGGDQSHPMGKPYGDRVDIRMYAPGDPVRYILWKIYARTGELVVRKPERALQPAERMLAYLIAAPRDSASAGAAQATIQAQGGRSDWKFGADGSSSIVTDVQQAQDLITRSAASEKQQGEQLGSFLREAQDERFQSLIIFAPPQDGSWIEHVLEQAKKINVSVVIGIDGLVPSKRFGRLRNFVFTQDVSPYSCQLQYHELIQVMTRLRVANISVQIADRRTGSIVDAVQMQKVFS